MARTLFIVVLCVVGLTVLLTLLGQRLLPEEGRAVADPLRGEQIFRGRGRCTSCHAMGAEGGGVRGPALDGVASRAGQRVAAMTAERYLVQSLLDPEAFVVPDFPRGLMPPAHLPPVSLSDDDLTSLVVFLLADGDREIASPRRVATVRGALDDRRSSRIIRRVVRGDADRGRAQWDRLGCASCHRLAGVTTTEEDVAAAGLGPALDEIGSYQSATYIGESIIEPDRVRVVGEGYAAQDGSTRMPTYGHLLSAADLDDLVTFLSEQHHAR